MAVCPLRPATHRRLGGPLPRQLANGPQAHPPVDRSFPSTALALEAYPVSTSLSRGCPGPVGRSPTCYSPVRRPPPRPKTGGALDLHALRTPPAFVLSQDQTLRPCPLAASRSFDRLHPSASPGLWPGARKASLLGFQRSGALRPAIVGLPVFPVKIIGRGSWWAKRRSRPLCGREQDWWPKRESNPCYQIESLAS